MEDAWLGKATERLFLPLLRMMLPELVDYNLPVEGVFHNMAIVAIDKQYPWHGRKIMHALWGMGQLMFTKCVVVVDKDVNVHDVAEVAWRVLNNIDPKRDVMISDGPVRRARPRVVLGRLRRQDGRRRHRQVEGRGLRARLAGGRDDGARGRGARRSAVERAGDRERSRRVRPSDEPRVQQMFDGIAPTYDTLNRVLSLGIDQSWRTKAIAALGAGVVRDGACSTSAPARSIWRRWRWARAPRSSRPTSRTRCWRRGRGKVRVPVVRADALALPFATRSSTASSAASGCATSTTRAPGSPRCAACSSRAAALVILDFFRPRRTVTRAVQALYNQRVLPLVGGIVSGDRGAYRYLADSIERFATRSDVERMCREVGFASARSEDLTLGVASMVVAS